MINSLHIVIGLRSILVFKAVLISIGRGAQIQRDCPDDICNYGSHGHVSCRGLGLDYIPRLPNDTEVLDLSDNIFNSLNNITFQNISGLPIRDLSLSNCNISEIEEDSFTSLPLIETLDLSRNTFTSNSSILKIGLASLNRSKIKTLNLSSQALGSMSLRLDTFDGLSGTLLETLILRDGYLEKIEEDIFSKLKYLTTLDVSNNNIRDIKLKGLRNLTTLVMNKNRLYKIPRFCKKRPIINLVPNLKYLFLSNNHISDLRKPARYGTCLPQLKKLYLTFNPIGVIHAEQFLPLKSLEVLDLDFMLVLGLSIERHAFSSSSLKMIRLGAFKHIVTDQQLNMFENCSSLQKLEMTNIKLNKLSDKDMRKLFRPILNLTLLAIRYAFLSYVPSIVSEMRNLERLSLYNNYISHWTPDTFQSLTKLIYINLKGNRITVVNETSFPKTILSQIEKLILIYNPFSCTCDNYWFINWAKKNREKLLNNFPDTFKCYSPPNLNDRPMSWYNPNYLECRGLQPYETAIVVAGTILLVFLTAGLLYIRYRWHLRYYIYLLRSKKEKYQILHSDEFKYDAFVAYTSDDRSWVISNLMAVLEGQHNFSLCLHERDFLPGKTIIDQISTTIKHSRKVILVLSNNFAKSQWCQYEILLAQHRFLEEGGNSLILILLDEIKGKYMTNCLGMLLRTMTYITWTDNAEGKKLFWHKMILSMNS
ncbi:hypothetical protein FSP39_010587 [Pinctada imbricata]|uniref:TIR domain-containing protein n=1 Tax=Pinctada imbricata TaxID=66713 RepID=A0AA88XTU4_PINIB|nr:hypothetical protein FSP39_010587 [Pinctada imbricata]